MAFIEDYDVDYSSKIYINLKNKIFTLKKENKPLLIKINSHPCSGKSTFIREHNKKYKNLILYDMDDETDIDMRKSFLIADKKDNCVLFGAIEKERFDDVIYIYVMPKLQELYKNIVNRQIKHSNCNSWADPIKIKNSRHKLYERITKKKDNTQFKPLFYSFNEALDFCIDTYK